MEPDKILRWFSQAIESLARTLQLESAGSKTLVAIEIIEFFFLVACLIAFLMHDLIMFVVAWLLSKSSIEHSFEVFLVTMLISVISLILILWHERAAHS